MRKDTMDILERLGFVQWSSNMWFHEFFESPMTFKDEATIEDVIKEIYNYGYSAAKSDIRKVLGLPK